MENYINYKKEVDGIENVEAMVKTIEQIAASRIHVARELVEQLGAYNEAIGSVLTALQKYGAVRQHRLFALNQSGPRMLVILAGNKGLVGGLWHDLINVAVERIKDYGTVVVVGKKGEGYLGEENITTNKKIIVISDIPTPEEIRSLGTFMIDAYRQGDYSAVDIAYPRFISLVTHEAVIEPFLPFQFTIESMAKKRRVDARTVGLPIIEPSKNEIVDILVEKYIAGYVRKIMLEANLSELSARTVTMEHAGEKTKQLLGKLRLAYAKQRIRVLTQKQIESFTVHTAVRGLK